MNKKAAALVLLGFALVMLAISMGYRGFIRLVHCQWQLMQCVENPQSIIDVLWPVAAFVAAIGLFIRARRYCVTD